MQQQSGMFSSVFNLNVLFNLSDDLSTLRARPVCELYTDFKTKQVWGVKLLYFIFERIALFAHSLSWYCCCSVLFIVGIALSLQANMLLFPLSGTQQARSSSFPHWPREVCDLITLQHQAVSLSVLILNVGQRTIQFSALGIRQSIQFPVLWIRQFCIPKAWFGLERVLQRTGYSLILTYTVLKATFKGLNEKVVPSLISPVSRQSPAGFNFPLFPLFQLAPCSRAIATGFKWTRASPPFWTQHWRLGAYIVFIIIEIEFSWLSDSVRWREPIALFLHGSVVLYSLLGCNALGRLAHDNLIKRCWRALVSPRITWIKTILTCKCQRHARCCKHTAPPTPAGGPGSTPDCNVRAQKFWSDREAV